MGEITGLSIICQCGQRIRVTQADAGSQIKCECGAKNAVPRLSELRREERSHSMAVADMRAGGGNAGSGDPTAPPAAPPPDRGGGPTILGVGGVGVQARLDKILGLVTVSRDQERQPQQRWGALDDIGVEIGRR